MIYRDDPVTGAWTEDHMTWEYYENGELKTDFSDRKSIEIHSEVKHVDVNALKGLSRDFMLKVEKGSYAECFAKQYGYQYDNGTQRVTGYDIKSIEEKADWIINHYVVDNYKGSKLTDLETARVLHDWLATNATYDYYGLNQVDAVETVDMLYRLYLGRPADPAGRAYWVDRMQNGMTLQELNDGFADSAEFGGIVAGYGLQ